MPGYLKTYYEEMRADLAEEIAYLQGANTDYGSNIKLRAVEARLAYGDMRQDSYRYRKGINASWQPLNRNNNGYRYGDGINIIGAAEISGSLNKDLALSLTPRFSYDKDQHGDASIEEGYVKTHLGVWGIELGKQAVQWGKAPFAMSNNATPQTMLKLNLLEPHTFDNGFLKFLGKANVNVFYSRLEGNRADKAQLPPFPRLPDLLLLHHTLLPEDPDLTPFRLQFPDVPGTLLPYSSIYYSSHQRP